MAILTGCGNSNQAVSPNGIPENGTPAQMKQAVEQNAAKQSEAAKNMPVPGAKPAPAQAGGQ